MPDVTLTVPESDIARVTALAPEKPRVAMVLGSGLSGLADAAEGARSLPYAELEGFPRVDSVAGHSGRLVAGAVGGMPVLLFQGRAHLYQGVTALDAAYPARLAAAAGCTVFIVTNAAGGVNESLRTGDITLIRDHINLMGRNPLVGWPGPAGGTPFVSMSEAYNAGLRELALEAAAETGIALKEGVYAGLLGPTYETPAEVRMLRSLGADMVGMSTVPEVISARALGMRVLGMSLITNAAAGECLSHDEVLEAGHRAAAEMTTLATAILRKL